MHVVELCNHGGHTWGALLTVKSVNAANLDADAVLTEQTSFLECKSNYIQL